MRKTSAGKMRAQFGAAVCVPALLSVALSGCKSGSAGMSDAEKQNWKGSAPPAGFQNEMAKQNREWQEREARTAAKLGKSATPPPGATVK